MATSAFWRTIQATLITVPMLVIVVFSPLTTSAATTHLPPPIAAWKNNQDITALSPSDLIRNTWTNGGNLDVRKKIAEAKAILQELRDFVNAAKHAVELGDRLKVLRLANQRLRRDLERDAAASQARRRQSRPNQADIAGKVQIIVANWLAATRLNHMNSQRKKRLAASERAWRRTESRASLLREMATELRADVQVLRAERAALAVELGRARRQINAVKLEARSSELDRLVIDARIMELRKDVSSGLRAILTGAATP